MTNKSIEDWLRAADSRMPAVAMTITAALAPIAPRATVPVLFVLFAYQLVRMVRPLSLPRIDILVAAGFAALVSWSYLSTFWALAPTGGATTRLLPLFIAGFCVIGWVGARDTDRFFVRDLCIGIAIATIIYVFEYITYGWLSRAAHHLTWRDIIDDASSGVAVMSFLINGTAILALLMWPALTGLLAYGRRWSAFAVFLVVAGLTSEFGSESGLIAIVLGWLAWWSCSIAGRKAIKAFAILFVVIVLVTPLAVSRVLTAEAIDRVVTEVPHVPNSALVRLKIWKFASERIEERPLVGWGFDAARRIPGGGEKFVLRNANGRIITSELYLPLHPHNQILQIWLELGAVGALIVALTGAAIIAQTAKLPSGARNGSAALIVSALVFANLSYGAWQSWWIATLFLVAAAQVSANRLVDRPG